MRHLLSFLALVFFLVLPVGCYRALEFEFGGDGGGGGDAHDLAGPSCASLAEAACGKRSDCRIATCPGCPGNAATFHACRDKDDDEPTNCPEYKCPPACSTYKDAASCQKIPEQGCQINDCCGFKGCLPPDAKVPPCAADCAPDCSLLNQANCKTAGYCHPVYEGCYPNESCDLLPVFKTCALGAAQCNYSEALCDAIPPSCPEGFVPGIANGCYEGCVPQVDCCSPGCKTDERCDYCWISFQCIPNNTAC